MSYKDAVSTKMMATHCVCCGRALVDAVSVQMGIGPECRQGDDGGISEDVREKANGLVFKASVAAQHGNVEMVKALAEEIRALGLDKLADKVGRRFKNADRYTDITITLEGSEYRIETPFRRGAKEEFIAAWRAIPGRKFRNEANYVPVTQKKALWDLLSQFFGGKFGKGPKGVFRIPTPEPSPKQGELNLVK